MHVEGAGYFDDATLAYCAEFVRTTFSLPRDADQKTKFQPLSSENG